MKKLIAKVLEVHARKVAKNVSLYERDLFHQLQKKATGEAIEYISTNMPHAICLRSDEHLLRYGLKRAPDRGLILEFGVYKGRTIRVIASETVKFVDGFDSFEGLPEDWSGWKHPAGYFSLGGNLPVVPSNVRLHKGWFSDSLPRFLEQYSDDVAFIHIHCDLYSSTRTVFEHLATRIKPGTIICIHEYFNYAGWRDNEFKAFQEFVRSHNVKYKYLAFASSEAGQVCIQIQ